MLQTFDETSLSFPPEWFPRLAQGVAARRTNVSKVAIAQCHEVISRTDTPPPFAKAAFGFPPLFIERYFAWRERYHPRSRGM